jgi:Kelch motif/Galactose oxidase, central domain
MVPLRDGGAMVVGGINPDDVAYSSIKRFDPTSGTWSDGPLLARAVGQPLAATLADGRVLTLSARTFGETGSATSIEALAPGEKGWEAAAEVDIYVDVVVAMTDGRLLAKGSGFESPPLFSVYDPSANRWASIDAPIDVVSSLDYGSFGALVPLDDGDVLALNVARTSSDPSPSTHVERFDARSRAWSGVASMSVPREAPLIARLADGRIFVAGGATGGENEGTARALASSEIYDPATDSWTPGPDLLEPRKDGHATQLADGSILIYGGDADFNVEGDVPWCPSPMTSVERAHLGS